MGACKEKQIFIRVKLLGVHPSDEEKGGNELGLEVWSPPILNFLNQTLLYLFP